MSEQDDQNFYPEFYKLAVAGNYPKAYSLAAEHGRESLRSEFLQLLETEIDRLDVFEDKTEGGTHDKMGYAKDTLMEIYRIVNGNEDIDE